MDQDQEISRGQQAAELMEQPLLVEAFETLQNQYLTAWQESPVRDSAGREEIWRLLKSLNAVQAHLRQVAETGKLATIQKERDSMLQKAKDGFTSRFTYGK